MIKPQKDEEFVEAFCSIVKKKLTKWIDIKGLYYKQIEERDIFHAICAHTWLVQHHIRKLTTNNLPSLDFPLSATITNCA